MAEFRLVGGTRIVSVPSADPPPPPPPPIPGPLALRSSTEVVEEMSGWTSTSTPTATRSNMGVTTQINGRNGAVLGPNGLIYASGGENFLIINPATGTARTSTLGADFTDPVAGRGWYGGVLARDGRIFWLPYNGRDVLVIDTRDTTADSAGTAYRTTFGGVVDDTPGDSKYYGGVLGGNGKIYAVPAAATDVLVIDPETDTAVRTNYGINMGGLNKWHGGVVGVDGKIYCIPGSIASILVIDPANETAVATTMGAVFPAGAKWRGGALGPDGKIYGAPSSIREWLVIDTVLQTATLNAFGDTGPVPSNGWWGAAVGADGRIYTTPRIEPTMLVLNTATGTSTRESFGVSLVSPSSNKWAGGMILALDGSLYAVPFSATDILKVDTNGSGAQDLLTLLSPALNKY